ncbi:hypothetical protein SAMN05192558_104234 [Actinokineospora alba]|uniref:Neocarzinostatin family protein n=1 Tax=Actinokineospora alba TaxID=504798 RepID=A0A1H0LPZ1_9PSEU|nr:hypothetical protein [Actinokineospora alba]TDP67407.1 hypothetical protein C8E96_2951 [Actinokineospora alba]SDI97505.1 hypothetical protein SAMN05421871_10963 [Actinokineospora alba]SDO70234.1 hypothetical protein SAMN05192558_104234 [Actinokineospora alba]
MRLRFARSTAALGLAGCALLGIAGPAGAASAPQGFNISTSSGGTYAGWANAYGNVVFHGTMTFEVTATVADKCPADGAGAYVRVESIWTDGSVHVGNSFVGDASGCSDGITATGRTYPTEPMKVKSVRVTVRECDKVGTSLNCSENSADIARSTWKDNPYT